MRVQPSRQVGASLAGRSPLAADSSTFAPALRLLPEPLKSDVAGLYAVLRSLDDLVDEHDPRALQRVQGVQRWAQGGRPQTPEAHALADLAQRHDLPRQALLQFCEGMSHDIAGASIESERDLARYCQQAGGAVGIVLARMLGTIGDRGEAERRMAALGRAMQVTNILRDIDEDLGHGRLYIPRSAIDRLGFPAPGAREQLLREGIACADALYEEGQGAIPLLREGGRAMALAAALYREILRQIERDGFGQRAGRVRVAPQRTRALIDMYSLEQPRAMAGSGRTGS